MRFYLTLAVRPATNCVYYFIEFLEIFQKNLLPALRTSLKSENSRPVTAFNVVACIVEGQFSSTNVYAATGACQFEGTRV